MTLGVIMGMQKTVEKIHFGKRGTFEVRTENSVYMLDVTKTGGCRVSGGILPQPRDGHLTCAKRGEPLVVAFRGQRNCSLITSEVQAIVRVTESV